jgi:AcrR family transcriptional regulator
VYNLIQDFAGSNHQSLAECRIFNTVMQTRSETRERTRQNLMQAFWSLYMVKRIDKITVREVAQRAGCNRSTFYEYFLDVYDVLEQIEVAVLPTLDELPPLLESGEITPAFVQSFLGLYRERLEYYAVLLGEKGDPAFQRKLINTLKSSLLQSLAHSPQANLAEMDLVLEYVLSGLTGVLIYATHSRPELTEEQLVAVLYNHLQGDMVAKIHRLLELPGR